MKKNLLLIFFLFVFSISRVSAQSVPDLQTQIDSHTQQIQKLDAEIKQYQAQIDDTSQQANTLQNAIKLLDISQQKLSAQIQKTQASISSANLSLIELSKEIHTTENKIDNGKAAIAQSLRNVKMTDDMSLPQIMLGSGSMGQAFDAYQKAESFSVSVEQHAKELASYKQQVVDTQTATQKKRAELLSLQSDLKDQNAILANNKKDKNALLAETKNKESTYRQIVATKQAQKAQFEKELFDYESKLKVTVDPNSFPGGKKGILSWPLDSIRVTQPFGKTVDSQRLYVSGTHNGVDFAASRGTPVKAVLDGVVQATGNTDLQHGCYSYGKWVLIKHANGLTSLYAHFDLIKVSPGQTVSTGEVIGYSGSTGYATGPHLHLTLYASEGVKVMRYTNSINCKNVDIPIAPASAYLDPLVYLPPL